MCKNLEGDDGEKQDTPLTTHARNGRLKKTTGDYLTVLIVMNARCKISFIIQLGSCLSKRTLFKNHENAMFVEDNILKDQN